MAESLNPRKGMAAMSHSFMSGPGPSCKICNNQFSFRDHLRTGGGTRLPLLLSCGHAACDVCIRGALAAATTSEQKKKKGQQQSCNIECSDCKFVTEVSVEGIGRPMHRNAAMFHTPPTSISDDVLFKLVPVDYYTLGLLVTRKKEAERRGDGIEFVHAVRREQPKSKILPKKTAVSCAECTRTSAQLFCKDCKHNYCTSCFKMSHQTRIFSTHITEAIGLKAVARSKESRICLTHNKRMEFFCEGCSAASCSDCAILGEHKGHTIVNIFDKLKAQAEDACMIGYNARKRLAYTVKSLQSKEADLNRRSSEALELARGQILKQIRNLQLLDTRTAKAIEERTKSQIANANQLAEEIQAESAKLESLIAEVESALREPPADVSSFNSLLSELAEYADIPSLPSFTFIIEENRDTSLIERVTAELAALTTTVKEYVESCTNSVLGENIRIIRPSELDEQGLVRLQRIIETQGDLPPIESFIPAVSPMPSAPSTRPPSIEPRAQSRQSLSGPSRESVSSPTSVLEDDDVPFFKVEALQKAVDKKKMERKAAATNQKIVVCHVNTPSDFCVQKINDKAKYLQLEAKFNEWAEKLGLEEGMPAEIVKGGLYLAKSEMFNAWYRAEVVAECGCYSEGKKEGHIYEVYYIDYGNMEKLEDHRLKTLPAEFRTLPGIALKCTLEDLVPYNEETNEYSPEAIETFRDYALMGTYDMMIYRKVGNTLYVDFGRPPRQDVIEDGVASVRDAMVWLKHGKFTNPRPVPKVQITQKSYFTLDNFLKNTEYQCIVGHVESPSELYLQLWTEEDKSNILALEEIGHEMQLLYNAESANSLNLFYVEKGLMCAALFRDRKWYRAVILESMPHRTVKVLYVDFGNTMVIPISGIRKLNQKFAFLPAQAVKCKLLDVTPVGPDSEWSPEAKKALVKHTETKTDLTCTADTVELSTNEFGQSIGVLSIVLEEKGQKFDTCINALLVEEALAISTGPSSRVARHRKPGVDVNIAITPQTQQEQKPEARKVPKGLSKEAHRVKVQLAHAENPSCLYIRMLDQASIFFDHEEFSAHMKQIPAIESVEDLKKAKKVAYYDKSDRLWKRGVVQSLYEANDTTYAKIYLVDHGPTLSVPAMELKPVEIPKFAKHPSTVRRAALAGVKPPGGMDKWSGQSISTFKAAYEGRDFICVKNEVLPDKTLLVSLYVEEFIDMGPLEPKEKVMKSVAKLFAETGDALPISSPDNDDDETSEEEILSEGAAVEPEEKSPELQNWIPAVPFKSKEFNGRVTWVGMACDICIQDIEASDENLSMLGRLLNLKYQDSEQKSYDRYYSRGDVCIARFPVDSCWYRARIIDRSPEEGKYDVEFVDYGNEEVVEIKDLRKNTFMEDMPIQQVRCMLYNLLPVKGEKWEYGVLTYIHQTIVDREVFVKVHNFGEVGQVPLVSLILANGIDLSNLLVKENLARWATQPPPQQLRSSKREPPKSAENLESQPKYDLPGFENYRISKVEPGQNKAATASPKELVAEWSDDDFDDGKFMFYPARPVTPEESSAPAYHKIPSIFGTWKFPGEFLLPVEVSAVNEPVTIFVQPRLMRDSETVAEMNDCIKEWTERVLPFFDLSAQLNTSGPRLPPLTKFDVGTACIALYTDGVWYRGIIAKDGEQPIVYYTDYGNHGPTPKENIRQCLPSLACLPPFGAYVTLDKLKFVEEPPASETPQSYLDLVNTTLLQVLMTLKDRLWGRFKMRDGDVFVELLDPSGTELAYRSLIDKGYFKLDD